MDKNNSNTELLLSISEELKIPRLSIEQYKKLIGDDSISDELAMDEIQSLYQLSVLAYYSTTSN